MFSKYFLVLCAFALVFAIVSVSAQDAYEEEVDVDLDDFEVDSVEARINIGKKVLKILKKFFKHASEECLKQALKKCKKHWYNPAKVIQCAKDFFSIENAGCLVGA